ncbi:hypothetical protein DFH06DRAFT_1190862 [Mycena polygramma]|nr:hypothetical protein DFH06DRAFT_1190854 [Mycena polygramma]KAJ7662797.1 hypothetical protein DFH06DRAFT_1190862 [Mycena polygramma]
MPCCCWIPRPVRDALSLLVLLQCGCLEGASPSTYQPCGTVRALRTAVHPRSSSRPSRLAEAVVFSGVANYLPTLCL